MFFAEIIFFLSLFCIFYPYFFYPLFLKIASKNKQLNLNLTSLENLPTVSILMAAYNEEKVLEQKIRSVFNSDYPKELIEFYVGSDCSSDKTNEILLQLEKEFPQLKINLFTERQGKVKIINSFFDRMKNEIAIITDANIMFEKNTLLELISPFSDEKIGLVDTQIIHTNLQKDGISHQESTYLNFETNKKHQESILFGIIAGTFGGCYAVRKKLLEKVPENFLVDDFFICIKVILQNFKAIINVNARVFEDISNDAKVEFRRKIRIATGSFQNLFFFFGKFLNIFSTVGFVIFSHKVLRWFGPFFILFAVFSLAFLSFYSQFYLLLFLFTVVVILLCCVDIFLRKFNIHLFLIRYLTHFLISNFAILLGFFRYLRGVESSVWLPTQRNQK